MSPATLEQKMNNLAKARVVRARQFEIRKDLSERRMAIADALTDSANKNLHVIKIIQSLPEIGPTRARRIMHKARIIDTTYCGRLTERQIGALECIWCDLDPMKGILNA